MPLINVFVTESKKPSKKKMDNELLWYDSLRQRMYKLKGSHIVMRLRLETEEEKSDIDAEPETRWLPVAMESYVNVKETVSNLQEILDWAKKNNIDVNHSSLSEVVLDVDKQDLDNVLDELDRNNFSHEVDNYAHR